MVSTPFVGAVVEDDGSSGITEVAGSEVEAELGEEQASSLSEIDWAG